MIIGMYCHYYDYMETRLHTFQEALQWFLFTENEQIDESMRCLTNCLKGL